MNWQPIETAPVGKQMFLAVAVQQMRGRSYVTDPYCVWQQKQGKFSRWPHDFLPTHWHELPEPPHD